MMFEFFNNQLYDYQYDFCQDMNILEENDMENSDKDDAIYNNLEKELESLIDDNSLPSQSMLDNNYNYRKNKRNNNKKKIKKMKNYNIKKGDWQCINCLNINFHFRTVCNICKKIK